MPTLEQQLADAIAACNALTQTVTTYKQQLDQSVASQKAAYDAWKASAKGEYPMPPNMIKNTYMDSVINGVPEGYAATGLTLEAVHPYTKGFEGCYTETAPANASASQAGASASAPFWYGRYTKGSRFPNWCGGLADGWASLGNGNILKITAVPGTSAKDCRQLYMPLTRRTYTSKVGFRAWVYLAKGSKMLIGNHAGYQGANGSKTITKAEFDAAKDGWIYVDMVADVCGGMGVKGNIFNIGFANDEQIEAYLAMPHLYTFMHQSPAGIPIGE